MARHRSKGVGGSQTLAAPPVADVDSPAPSIENVDRKEDPVKRFPSRFALPLLAAFVLSAVPATRLAAERMYDAELKRLIEATNKGVVAFRKAARPDFRNSRITWEGNPYVVSNYLEDLEDAGKKLQSRYDLNNAAVPEATDFLKRVKVADQFAVENPGISGAKNEWNALRTNVVALAAAYGIDFASDPATWQPARTPDGPIRAEAFAIETQGKTLVKSLDNAAKSAGLDKSRRKVIEGQAEMVETSARNVRRAVDGGREAGPAIQSLESALADLSETVQKDGLAEAMPTALQDSIGKLKGYLGS
jgi:hypothetical protein